MQNIILNKIKSEIKVFILLTVFFAVTLDTAVADSTHFDSAGNSFVLGKGGSRLKLQGYNNITAVIVGQLDDKYVAMLGYKCSDPKLNGRLFLLDDISIASGTCSWDGREASIINIEGKNLNELTIDGFGWPHKYMQTFWFDMRTKVGDTPDIWAVTCSCYSHHCYIFKYNEEYDINNTVKKRTLQYKTTWNFGNVVRGIDVLDLNNQIVKTNSNELRCPPIFVEVSRGYGNEGINNNFWCVSSELWFKNIVMKEGVPGTIQIGTYHAECGIPLDTYSGKQLMSKINKDDTYIKWGGIAGGGVSGLGLYKNNTPTFAYYTMESETKLKHSRKYSGGDPYYYNWYINTVSHTFEFDKSSNTFNKLQSRRNGSKSFSTGDTSKEMTAKLDGLFESCSTILFDTKGPYVSLIQDELTLIGKNITGTTIEGKAGELFGNNGRNEFIGQLDVEKCENRKLLEKEEYTKGEKGKKLKLCDEQGRQVLAIFMGYPLTAVQSGDTDNGSATELIVNFENVETDGIETGSGVSAEWSAGFGHECKILPIEFHTGYQGYLNSTIKKNSGSTFDGNIVHTKNFSNTLKDYRNKGTVFFTNKLPVLVTGKLLWKNDKQAVIEGIGNIIPLSGGVRPSTDQVDCNYFNLNDTNITWDEVKETYSAMTAGLEKKDKNFNYGKGNLFEFKNEQELKKLVNESKNSNYQILKELKNLADFKAEKGKDTFKDRPVKWLVPTDPGKYFGYGWKTETNFQMNFSSFENKEDTLEQGHGGYWEFSVFGVEGKGSVTAQSSSCTYTNSTSKNGFAFKSPAVNYNLTNNYSIRYWGFNINPKAYKKMNIGNSRPEFIPEYCWNRDQSFALFVPEVVGCSVNQQK